MVTDISVRDIRINKSSKHIRSYHCLKKGLIMFSAFILVDQNKKNQLFPRGDTTDTRIFKTQMWWRLVQNQTYSRNPQRPVLQTEVKAMKWGTKHTAMFQGAEKPDTSVSATGVNFFWSLLTKDDLRIWMIFFSPLKIACQNNTCFCWPHGRHGNCANPSHWYHSPPSIYHVCSFLKGYKNPLAFVIFFSFTSVLKIVGKLYNVYPFLERQRKGKHHCCTPDSFTGLANPEPLHNRSDQELSAAPCFDSPHTKKS